MRTLVVGDIHGCYEELLDLLDKAGVGQGDRVISIGDMVNRGPYSANALAFFRENTWFDVTAIMGNHEYKHLQAAQGEKDPSLSMLLTRWQLDDDYDAAIAYMDTLPTYLELPEALLVHAFYEPNLPVDQQKEHVLVGTGGAERYLQQTYRWPWYRYYNADKPLIVGHRDHSGRQRPFIYRDRVYGIDTRCVYGGTLTGLWLPDFTMVSVAARRDHWYAIREAFSPPQ